VLASISVLQAIQKQMACFFCCGDVFADETWLPLRSAEPLRSAGALSNLQMSLCDMFVVSTVPFKRV
jgi:hypothetical protein